MIFVTIGSMFPFDRLVRAMDAWAEAQAETAAGPVPLLAQIGDGGYEPQHMRWVRSLDRDAYARAVVESDVVVAHAGMGSVITAGEHGKPIVLLPRLAAQGEHTSDHQVDTARWLRTRPGIHVADTEGSSRRPHRRGADRGRRPRHGSPPPRRRPSSPGSAASPKGSRAASP